MVGGSAPDQLDGLKVYTLGEKIMMRKKGKKEKKGRKKKKEKKRRKEKEKKKDTRKKGEKGRKTLLKTNIIISLYCNIYESGDENSEFIRYFFLFISEW